MPTGACGINCDVCRLNLLGICSSCGSGTSLEGSLKLSAQQKLFNGTCSILHCAKMNKKEYCMKDCRQFPCENFSSGQYPYSNNFLNMHKRRLNEKPPAFSPSGSLVSVPPEYWETLSNKEINTLCNLSLAEPLSKNYKKNRDKILRIKFLNQDLIVDIDKKCLKNEVDGELTIGNDPLLELITLLYLNNVKSFHPLGKDIVSVKDLKQSYFFKDSHKLKTDPLIKCFENDISLFKKTAKYLDGKEVEMGDFAYSMPVFPRIHIYILFWKKDDEFDTKISILFDRSIEEYFSAAGIWGLVNLVTREFIFSSRKI